MQRASNSATVEPLTSSLVGDIDMILCLIWYGLTANSVVILIITTAFPFCEINGRRDKFRLRLSIFKDSS